MRLGTHINQTIERFITTQSEKTLLLLVQLFYYASIRIKHFHKKNIVK